MIDITDEVIAERIARRYCELMRIDPEEEVVTGRGVAVLSPRWRVIASRVPSQLAWMQAIHDETQNGVR